VCVECLSCVRMFVSYVSCIFVSRVFVSRVFVSCVRVCVLVACSCCAFVLDLAQILTYVVNILICCSSVISFCVI
jgi:hypothetical protein